LEAKHPDVDFIYPRKDGSQGIDVQVPAAFRNETGFGYAEIKPNSQSGLRRFEQQVDSDGWMNSYGPAGYVPTEVFAITYDRAGNIFHGFHPALFATNAIPSFGTQLFYATSLTTSFTAPIQSPRPPYKR
jgi:hypothetical protein